MLTRTLLLFSGLSLTLVGAAQATPTTWQKAPSPIQRIIEADKPPAVTVSPDRKWMVEFGRPALPSLSEIAEPIVNVAGIRLNANTNAPARSYSWRWVAIRQLGPGISKRVRLPKGAKIRYLAFSLDSKKLSMALEQKNGLELWVVDLATRRAKKLTEPVLNASYGNPCDWLPGDDGLVCKIIPSGRGTPPARANVPDGPRIEENLGVKRPARTYTNLLQSRHDERLFEYYLTSELHIVRLDGTMKRLTDPAIVDDAKVSPDGRYVLVSTMHRPWSYHVPASRFPKKTVVLHRENGATIATIADLPLADKVPIKFGSVRQGRRNIGWRPDMPATLAWAEALDGGDAGKKAAFRDAVYTMQVGDAKPQLIWKSTDRFDSISWADETTAFATEWWFDTRRLRTWRIDPRGAKNAGKRPQAALVFDRNYQDQYANPGSFVRAPNRFGRWVVMLSGDRQSVFLRGRGASPKGAFPFLDRMNLATKQKQRLWQSEAPFYESVSFVLDNEATRVVTRRESKSRPPNYYLRTGAELKALKPLTRFKDPAPEFAGMSKKLVSYKRADGLELNATLYLPPNYRPGKRYPTVLWAYPFEHKSTKTAGQVTSSEHSFSRPYALSAMFLLTQGYILLDDPKMPIVGEGATEPNDNYVQQLTMGARAAVDFLVENGYSDRHRIAIGGHSYGAFTVANLLAHTDLFRAGIARSGAYNRTLTPFGFQGEQRNFWTATDVYMTMSPFTHAAKIDEPMLMIHGAEDSNSGTYPIQSERMYKALRGLGGTARWVVLPFEDHGYRSLEAAGHVHWETVRWLDQYVKRARPRGAKPRPASGKR